MAQRHSKRHKTLKDILFYHTTSIKETRESVYGIEKRVWTVE